MFPRPRAAAGRIDSFVVCSRAFYFRPRAKVVVVTGGRVAGAWARSDGRGRGGAGDALAWFGRFDGSRGRWSAVAPRVRSHDEDSNVFGQRHGPGSAGRSRAGAPAVRHADRAAQPRGRHRRARLLPPSLPLLRGPVRVPRRIHRRRARRPRGCASRERLRARARRRAGLRARGRSRPPRPHPRRHPRRRGARRRPHRPRRPRGLFRRAAHVGSLRLVPRRVPRSRAPRTRARPDSVGSNPSPRSRTSSACTSSPSRKTNRRRTKRPKPNRRTNRRTRRGRTRRGRRSRSRARRRRIPSPRSPASAPPARFGPPSNVTPPRSSPPPPIETETETETAPTPRLTRRCSRLTTSRGARARFFEWRCARRRTPARREDTPSSPRFQPRRRAEARGVRRTSPPRETRPWRPRSGPGRGRGLSPRSRSRSSSPAPPGRRAGAGARSGSGGGAEGGVPALVRRDAFRRRRPSRVGGGVRGDAKESGGGSRAAWEDHDGSMDERSGATRLGRWRRRLRWRPVGGASAAPRARGTRGIAERSRTRGGGGGGARARERGGDGASAAAEASSAATPAAKHGFGTPSTVRVAVETPRNADGHGDTNGHVHGNESVEVVALPTARGGAKPPVRPTPRGGDAGDVRSRGGASGEIDTP